MDFQLLDNYIKALPSFSIPGVACVVYRNHQPIFQQTAGFIDEQKKKPTTMDSLFYMYSVSKVMTAAAVMQLVEKGLLSLEDEVCKYLPAYTNMTVKCENGEVVPADKKITIFHLLTMTSGMSYEIYTDEVNELIAAGNATTRNVVNAVAKIPLLYQPGTRFKYSFGLDVLGAVVEVVSGMSFGEYMKANIFEPLGMDTAAYSPKKVNGENLADYFVFDQATVREKKTEPMRGARVADPFESGGAGVICSTTDMILFADALACGGVGKTGKRILSEESVNLMRQNHLDAQQLSDAQNSMTHAGYGYGFGVRTLMDPAQVPTLAAKGEFGWGGACGTYILSDTTNRISIAFAMQMTSHIEFSYMTHPHNMIRDLVYRALDF